MSALRSVTAVVEIALDEPREFTYTPSGKRYEGTYVQWRSYFSPALGYDHTSATLFHDDGFNAHVACHVDEAPDWCPLPPEGWDDKVRECREQSREVRS